MPLSHLRVGGRESRTASLPWPVFLTPVGVVLFFYHETGSV